MKITVISYDFWHYDAHITETLCKMGINAHHINLSAVSHKNFAARLTNAMSKVFLGKNLKEEHRKIYLLEKLQSLGVQDQILVINPELISDEHHKKIKTFTKKYTAFLYDSTARCPVTQILQNFDEVFSFDPEDCRTQNFNFITNYNYLGHFPAPKQTVFDMVYLASLDARLEKAISIAKNLVPKGCKILYRAATNKIIKKPVNQFENTKILISRKKVSHAEIPEFYKKSKSILDLVRDKQEGLSFRFFEAMALEKKVITDNKSVRDYDFYDPQNIFVLENANSKIPNDFFESSYRKLPESIFQKYTIESWVKKVFGL